MSNKASLIMENGTVFEGFYFGKQGEITGEIVFTTGMIGYLETLSDPSYFGQIVLQTFPLIGNYGMIPDDFESKFVGPSAYIVKHPCQHPSNFRSEGNLDAFLREKGIVGLYGIDTRALTKLIRENGVMNGKITETKSAAGESPDSEYIQKQLEEIKAYQVQNAVKNVSVEEKIFYQAEKSRFTVALLDFGYKENICRELMKRSCDVWVFPCDSKSEEILSVAPDGIMLSNGPGDPAVNTEIIENLKNLLYINVPIFGICLGHQLLALANGFMTHKLKYGHRGANQPVKDSQSGKVYITSQNHGYAIQSESIDRTIAKEWFLNVNDKTNEGLIYKNIKACSIQFHPEACGGPRDTEFLFDRFIQDMENGKGL